MDVSPEHLVEQARERFQLQDYYGAIHLLEEVLASGRAFADAHQLLGLSYALADQPDKALTQFDQALGLNPNYVEALIHRAIVLNELGREDEADAALRRAGQLSGDTRHGFPSHVAAKLANQHAALGDAYAEAGDLPQAIVEYQAALALGPSFQDLRYKLGRLLLDAGRALQAREQFEIIVRDRPQFLDAAAMLGLACYLAGDGLSARAVWEECRERRPEDPRVEAYLAMLTRSDVSPSTTPLASPPPPPPPPPAPPAPSPPDGPGRQAQEGVRRFGVAILALAFGCARTAADHEQLGDRAYAAGAYADALAEYELGLKGSPGRASLLAKAAAAALHTEDYTLAAAEYRALATADRSRSDEAADGLERVVRAALSANDRSALAVALGGIREIAPNRPLGRYARLVALDAADRGNSADALAFLPTAIAAAADGRSADSLLYLLGMAAVRARDCSTAVVVFEGVVRRARELAVVDGAREGLGMCALIRGQDALDHGHPAEAEDWFRRATAPGAAVDVARGAYIGLGDVRLAQGDVAAAVEAYHQALVGGTPGDSLTQKVHQKLNALGKADST